MSNIIEYSSKSAAIRAVVRLGVNKAEAEDFIAKASDGKFHVDKDQVEQALGVAGLSEGDQSLKLDYGHVNCPNCGTHLSNGVCDYDGLVDIHGEAKAYGMQKHEFACMACNYEFGPTIPAPTKRTANKTGRRYENRAKSDVEKPSEIVFRLADAKPEAPRKDIVAEAVAAGVTINTANAAYQHWRKARGLTKARG